MSPCEIVRDSGIQCTTLWDGVGHLRYYEMVGDTVRHGETVRDIMGRCVTL